MHPISIIPFLYSGKTSSKNKGINERVFYVPFNALLGYIVIATSDLGMK